MSAVRTYLQLPNRALLIVQRLHVDLLLLQLRLRLAATTTRPPGAIATRTGVIVVKHRALTAVAVAARLRAAGRRLLNAHVVRARLAECALLQVDRALLQRLEVGQRAGKLVDQALALDLQVAVVVGDQLVEQRVGVADQLLCVRAQLMAAQCAGKSK